MPNNRKPTALRVLEGNPGRRPIRATEPKPPVEGLICPAKMSREAKSEWARIVPQLKACGLLTRLDRALLVLYCETWADYVELRLNVIEFGRTFSTPNGYPMTRPEVKQLEIAQAQLRQLAAEFGLSPAARTRLEAPSPNAQRDDLDALLGS